MSNTMGQVNAEDGDRRAANGGETDEDRPFPAKVAVPLVAAGIEEPSAFASLGIDACKIRAFTVVVGEAGQREVAGRGLARVLFSDDVIDLEREFVVGLRHPAVFTAAVGELPNQLDKSDVHGRSIATVGTLPYLPSFRFENGENRANAFEVVHLRVFFGRESPAASLGRQFVHPSQVGVGEGKPRGWHGRAGRHFFVWVKDT